MRPEPLPGEQPQHSSGIPHRTLSDLRAYFRERRPVGSFLEAVLCNDLMAAIGRADAENLEAVLPICNFVASVLPAYCHGSHEAYERWLGGDAPHVVNIPAAVDTPLCPVFANSDAAPVG